MTFQRLIYCQVRNTDRWQLLLCAVCEKGKCGYFDILTRPMPRDADDTTLNAGLKPLLLERHLC
jgi:hypothetical protein